MMEKDADDKLRQAAEAINALRVKLCMRMPIHVMASSERPGKPEAGAMRHEELA